MGMDFLEMSHDVILSGHSRAGPVNFLEGDIKRGHAGNKKRTLYGEERLKGLIYFFFVFVFVTAV